LDLVLGMAAQRTMFHYGVELEGLKYNGPELGELRRRMGIGKKVELAFDPGDLGHINVFDPLKETYICVPAVDQAYATGLSLWQHKVIRRYAQHQLNARNNIVALAQAKAEIRALVERDFNRKSTHGRKRHARFMEDHSGASVSKREANQPGLTAPPDDESGSSSGMHDPLSEHTENGLHPSPVSDAVVGSPSLFTDDEVLPVFEAALDLPRSPVAPKAPAQRVPGTEEVDD
jgi:putative transposase